MADNTILIPAAKLAEKNKAHLPNESPEYRQARNTLLAEEIELRRHIERALNFAAPFPSAAEFRRTIPSKVITAQSASLSSSAIRTLSSSTA
jgi:predicted dithiol-disulfide oxidoreductase (DUF899 family)